MLNPSDSLAPSFWSEAMRRTLIALGTSLIVVVGVPQLFATDFIIG